MKIVTVDLDGNIKITDSNKILNGIKGVPKNSQKIQDNFLHYCSFFKKKISDIKNKKLLDAEYKLPGFPNNYVVTFTNKIVKLYKYININELIYPFNQKQLCSCVKNITGIKNIENIELYFDFLNGLYVMVEILSASSKRIKNTCFEMHSLEAGTFNICESIDDSINSCLSKIFGRFRSVKFNKFYDSEKKSLLSDSGLFTLNHNLWSRSDFYSPIYRKMKCSKNIFETLTDFIQQRFYEGYETMLLNDIISQPNNMSSAYISRVRGGCIIRLVSAQAPFFEHSRIYVPDDQDIAPSFANLLCNDDYVTTDPKILVFYDFDFNIIGSDDIRGTRLWYILKTCIKPSFNGNVNNIFDKCMFENIVDSHKMCMCLLLRGYENLLKMGYKNILSVVESNYVDGTLYTRILQKYDAIFGRIKSNATSFADMISIPNRFLCVLDEDERYCRTVSLINSVVNKEWFQSISADEFRELVKKVNNVLDYDISQRETTYTIDALTLLRKNLAQRHRKNYNHSEIYRYFEYIAGLYEYHNNKREEPNYDFLTDFIIFKCYDDYINMINNPVFYEMDFVWNPAYDDIYELHDTVSDILNVISDKDDAQKYNDLYQTVKERLFRYEFTDGNLSVIPPEDVMSIIIEGRSLHHCVRSYIDAICKKETEILFIRKSEEMDVPYFTLEIRDGTIRQCHGFGNCNPDYEVIDFLNAFCREKGIKTNDSNMALCV